VRRCVLCFGDVTPNATQRLIEKIGQLGMQGAAQFYSHHVQRSFDRHAEVGVELIALDVELLAEARAAVIVDDASGDARDVFIAAFAEVTC
jgi:hypothetical protein